MNLSSSRSVFFTEPEAKALLKTDVLPDRLQVLARQLTRSGGAVRLTDDDIYDLRERLLERLVQSGFDQDYKLNADGRILDALCDRLYLLLSEQR